MFKAFRIIRAAHPELLKCISTNGLLLDERADELIELGIDTLTVTVNAVDPAILARIVFAVRLNGKRLTGVGGAKLLIENQLKGIRRMAAAGTTIKVNTVLIPKLNDAHTEEVAKAVRDAGASIYNIIPLIPQHRFANFAAPSCEQIEDARERAGKHIDVFRHCMHCRADAVGIPGVSDHAAELFGERAEDVFSHG
jgi:nitrogen fixation protein NifB